MTPSAAANGEPPTSDARERIAGRVTAALRANGADLLRYVERRVGHDDAPDLLAEVMVVAWRRSGELPADEREARMWLYGVAHHVLANARRGERRRWALALRLREELGRAPASERAADHGLEVRDAVARLEPEAAELIRLVHWDGLTLAEAATVLGIPASTVRSRYARAKEDLRASLGAGVRNEVAG